VQVLDKFDEATAFFLFFNLGHVNSLKKIKFERQKIRFFVLFCKKKTF